MNRRRARKIAKRWRVGGAGSLTGEQAHQVFRGLHGRERWVWREDTCRAVAKAALLDGELDRFDRWMKACQAARMVGRPPTERAELLAQDVMRAVGALAVLPRVVASTNRTPTEALDG